MHPPTFVVPSPSSLLIHAFCVSQVLKDSSRTMELIKQRLEMLALPYPGVALKAVNVAENKVCDPWLGTFCTPRASLVHCLRISVPRRAH